MTDVTQEVTEVIRSATKREAEHWTIQHGHEWAFIFIDEVKGTICIESSFGTWGFTWSHHGHSSLKEFLQGVEYDYFFGKVDQHTHGRQFDFDKTIFVMRLLTIERRKEGDLGKEDARSVWDSIDVMEHVQTEHEFYDNLYHNSIIAEELYGWDISDVARYGRHPQCEGFWTQIWPVFLEATKLEK